LPLIVGVGQRFFRAMDSRLGRIFPTRPAVLPRLSPYDCAVGVGKYEKPLS
jgi:hypothetical protein